MFLKRIKSMFITILLIFTLIPNTYAYSEYIIASGKNIGIEIKSNGIMVVGLYEIDGISPGKDANIRLGDRIIKINDKKVNNIDEMVNIISKINNENIKVTFLRNKRELNTNLKLVKSNNIYKTGLYVKDTINGIGTLTYIDPGTNMYGALGHEIIDKNTSLKMEIKDGKIYSSTITNIKKSSDGIPGEKNATFDTSVVYGSINENTSSGIFGTYTSNIDDSKLYKVASVDEIKIGKAKILTVLKQNDIEEFDINIIRLNKNNSNIKNILFNITDEKLLSIAGGVVQGMSGSPIVQDDKIIGAVTHVVIDNPTKGYGIFITNMLEEMEN